MNKAELRGIVAKSGLTEGVVICHIGFPDDYQLEDYSTVFTEILKGGGFLGRPEPGIILTKWNEVAKEKYFLMENFQEKLEVLKFSNDMVKDILLDDIIMSAGKDIDLLNSLKPLYEKRLTGSGDFLSKIDKAIVQSLS